MRPDRVSGGSRPGGGDAVARWLSIARPGGASPAPVAWPPLVAPATAQDWSANDARGSVELGVAAPALAAELLELAAESAA